MAITIDVNGQTINYPEIGDTNWADEATDFAVQTASAFGKLGLDIGTSVDIPQTLDVTGNVTLDANLSVGGNASVTGNTTLTGNITVNGNSNLGNGSSDTIAVTGILNVDSGVLYVDPTNNRVGINDTTPSQALDVTGNALISGTLGVTGNSTFTGDVIASIVKASGSGGLTIDSNGGTDVALFGAGGGVGTTLYGGLNVTGDVAINTNKFNVTASSGDTAIAGTLGVTGNTTLTGRLLNSNGSVGSPSYSFTNETNSGWYRESAGVIALSVSGTKRMSLDSNGYLLKSNNVAGHFERTTSYSVSVVVNFDTAILSNANYNTTNGRFTSPVTGTYFFYVQGITQTSNRVGLYFRKNGVQYTNHLSVLGDANPGLMTGCHTAIIQLNASEYIDVFSIYAGTYTYAKSCFFGFYLIG